MLDLEPDWSKSGRHPDLSGRLNSKSWFCTTFRHHEDLEPVQPASVGRAVDLVTSPGDRDPAPDEGHTLVTASLFTFQIPCWQDLRAMPVESLL
jgi:hypothetical protein